MAKWVFRQNLTPERLKDILLLHKRGSRAETEGGEKEEQEEHGRGGERKEEEERKKDSLEEEDRTAGDSFSADRRTQTDIGSDGETDIGSDRLTYRQWCTVGQTDVHTVGQTD